MKKISKKKNLLTKTGLGVVAASLVMTPIVTAVACGTDTPAKPPYKSINTYKGKFSTPEKEQAFLNITDEVPNDAFMNETGLISITLPNVLTIGENAFAMDNPDDGNKLVKVNLPNVVNIKYNAFHNTNVTAIDFPNVMELGTELFSKTKLTSISLAKIKKIEDSVFAFYNNVTSLNLPVVVEISDRAFVAMDNLKTIDLPEVKKIGEHSFQTSGSVNTKIMVPKLENIGSVGFSGRVADGALFLPFMQEIYSRAFYNAQYTSIDLPLVTKIVGGAFGVSPIMTLRIPIINIDNVDDFSFTNIQAGAAVTVSDSTAWENNPRLERIFGPNFNQITFINA